MLKEICESLERLKTSQASDHEKCFELEKHSIAVKNHFKKFKPIADGLDDVVGAGHLRRRAKREAGEPQSPRSVAAPTSPSASFVGEHQTQPSSPAGSMASKVLSLPPVA